MTSKTLRVCIIGAGPSGIYTAEILAKKQENILIDIFDKLPTPFGLVRYGVAPDHLSIKTITKNFDKTLTNPKIRFFGNIEFGKDIKREELKKYYDIIVYAYGASSSYKLNIKGEELKGCISATDLVAWYNGHPEAKKINLGQKVAVIGLGNVALDIARVLLKDREALKMSDANHEAIEEIIKSKVQKVYIIGRRDVQEAKFTNKELKELKHLNVKINVEGNLDVESSNQVITRNIETFKEFSNTDGEKQLDFKFMYTPLEIKGENQVESIILAKNISENNELKQTNEILELEVDTIVTAIGYKGLQIENVEFNEQKSIIKNEKGKIKAGEYAVGWIKRGANGVIGTNRKCAEETVEEILKDLNNEKIIRRDLESIEGLDLDFFSYTDFKKLDQFELEEGNKKGRPRQKIIKKEEMLKFKNS